MTIDTSEPFMYDEVIMISRLADTSLSDSEQEQKKTERLLPSGKKKKPRSRRYRDERGPDPFKENRENNRILPDDPDLKKDTSDTSLRNRPGKKQKSSEESSSFDKVSCLVTIASRLAQYHGVLDNSGNPTDPPNTEYKSYDNRYFNNEHYKSIISHAKDLLKEDYFKYGWDGGSADAPIRAALDTAIQIADGSLYQNKINPDVYNYLLNKISGDKIDTYQETLMNVDVKTSGRKRSATQMHKELQNLVTIASSLRKSNPKASVAILRTAHNLIAADEKKLEIPSEIIRGLVNARKWFEANKAAISKHKEILRGIDENDIEKLMSDIDALQDGPRGPTQQASVIRRISSLFTRISAGLEIPAQITKDLAKSYKWFVDNKAAIEKSKQDLAGLDENDIEKFMSNLDAFIEAAESAPEGSSKQSSAIKILRRISAKLTRRVASPESIRKLIEEAVGSKLSDEDMKKIQDIIAKSDKKPEGKTQTGSSKRRVADQQEQGLEDLPDFDSEPTEEEVCVCGTPQPVPPELKPKATQAPQGQMTQQAGKVRITKADLSW